MDNKRPTGKLFVPESNFDGEWEDVLNTINIESLPVRYLKTLILKLKNKDTFVIDVQDIVRRSNSIDEATKKINQIITDHRSIIETIDFSIRVDALMENVTKARNAFTKKMNFKIKRQGKKK